VDYISTAVPTTQYKSNQNQLMIKTGNYFKLPEENIIPLINETAKTITLYNVSMKKAVTLPIKNTEFELPYSHSLIITPESDIFVSGGIFLSNNEISGDFLRFSTNEMCLQKCAKMNVKRVGHALVYAEHEEGVIFAIGGVSD